MSQGVKYTGLLILKNKNERIKKNTELLVDTKHFNCYNKIFITLVHSNFP